MVFNKIKKAFKENKYLLLKKAIRLETFRLDFDFDMMFSLFAKYNDLNFSQKKQFVGQIIDINSIPIFKTYLDYIATHLKDLFYLGNLDFFYSLKGEIGPAHKDKENVLILGVKNITYYHIDDIDIEINPGDILFVPKNMLHHSFSSRERIVLSLSLWEKN